MASSSDPLLRFRSEFPILEECVYLVSHSLGAMPRGAAGALDRYAREWAGRATRAWEEGWWELPRTMGDLVAPLLGAATGTVVLEPNVTLAGALFLSAIDFSPPRDRLVTTTLDFPSFLYMLRGQKERGAHLVEVPSDDGITIDTERMREAIDERTRIVAISHVLFRSSYLQDVAAITARAREVGAVVLLDVYQSAGVVPIDLDSLGVDAAVGGCLKWLCGGPGNAFLYVRPDRIETLRPRLTGWQAHRDPFAFDAGEFVPADGIERFLHGTPSVPAIRAAEAGLRIVGEAGVEAIREKSVRQTSRILERCAAEGWTVNTPADPARRGGTVTVNPPGAREISGALIERGILVDHRPGAGIRIAPHFYNEDAEIDRALDEIASRVRAGRSPDPA